MKTIHLLSLTLLFVSAAVLPALAQGTAAGAVDLTFSPNTGTFTGYPNNQVTDAVVLTNGRVLIAGAFSLPPSTAQRGLVRLNTDGSRDATFVGYANSTVSRLLPTSDGRFYCFGIFTSVNSTAGFVNFALIDANGNLDTAFVPTGLGMNNSRDRMAVGPDNKLLVNTASNLLVRVGFNGAPETSFIVSAFVGSISAVAVHTNGQIYVMGVASSFPNLSYTIVRLNSDGSPDTSFVAPTFGTSAGAADARLSILKVQPDGKPILLGGFSFVGSTQRGGIARLNAGGSLDPTFVPGAGGIGTIYQGAGLIGLTDFAMLPDGRIVIWRDGVFRYNNAFRYGIARISSTGALDAGFDSGTGPADTAADPYSDGWGIRTVAAGPNGEIYVGGVFTNFNSTNKKFLVRLNRGPITTRPTIVTTPQSQSVASGADVVFSVGAIGPAPLTYVWRHNNKVVAGATNNSLTLTNVQLADVGGYIVTVLNPAGAAAAAPAVLTVNGVSVPDLSGPGFKITSPAGTFVRAISNQFAFRGTATDNLGLAALCYQQNTNPWVQVPLMTNWNFTVTLDPGTNRFRLKATDIANNNSATQSFVAFYVVTQTVALTINGNGMVTGATNGQGFEIGRNYPLSAVPKPGNLFSNWISDGVIVTNATRTFFA